MALFVLLFIIGIVAMIIMYTLAKASKGAATTSKKAPISGSELTAENTSKSQAEKKQTPRSGTRGPLVLQIKEVRLQEAIPPELQFDISGKLRAILDEAGFELLEKKGEETAPTLYVNYLEKPVKVQYKTPSIGKSGVGGTKLSCDISLNSATDKLIFKTNFSVEFGKQIIPERVLDHGHPELDIYSTLRSEFHGGTLFLRLGDIVSVALGKKPAQEFLEDVFDHASYTRADEALILMKQFPLPVQKATVPFLINKLADQSGGFS